MISFYEDLTVHYLPYGAPRITLAIILPLIEIVRIITRPFILRIRLSTNLAAGHILLLIVSYFNTLLPSASTPLIIGISILLQGLELGIGLIQAYIFVTLIKLYFQDIINNTY